MTEIVKIWTSDPGKSICFPVAAVTGDRLALISTVRTVLSHIMGARACGGSKCGVTEALAPFPCRCLGSVLLCIGVFSASPVVENGYSSTNPHTLQTKRVATSRIPIKILRFTLIGWV